jgi:hypothetical protein
MDVLAEDCWYRYFTPWRELSSGKGLRWGRPSANQVACGYNTNARSIFSLAKP